MDERKPPSAEEIKGILERADEIRHESERVRDRADHAIRQRPFWPDRRRTGRSADHPGTPERRRHAI
jgi:hypothetical protein